MFPSSSSTMAATTSSYTFFLNGIGAYTDPNLISFVITFDPLYYNINSANSGTVTCSSSGGPTCSATQGPGTNRIQVTPSSFTTGTTSYTFTINGVFNTVYELGTATLGVEIVVSGNSSFEVHSLQFQLLVVCQKAPPLWLRLHHQPRVSRSVAIRCTRALI